MKQVTLLNTFREYSKNNPRDIYDFAIDPHKCNHTFVLDLKLSHFKGSLYFRRFDCSKCGHIYKDILIKTFKH